jgi:septal ring factor EnvC (AmiA/AmiB activator)
MAISSISSLATSSYAASDTSGKIIQLQRQLKSIQKQITAENNSTDDKATKAQKVKQYQTMMNNIKTRIQQMQTSSTTNTQRANNQKANAQSTKETSENRLSESQTVSEELLDAQNGIGQVIDVSL